MKNTIQHFRNQQAELKKESEWFNLRPYLGFFGSKHLNKETGNLENDFLFMILIGARMAGKSFVLQDYACHQFIEKGIPFIWMRLTKDQADSLLTNNAEKLLEPIIKRKYGLNLISRGNNVYSVKYKTKTIHHKDGTEEDKQVIVEKKLMCQVFALSTFYSDKGENYDADFLKSFAHRNIFCDEFNRDSQERNTFDIVYGFANQLENIMRTEKSDVRIFMAGNNVAECSDICCAFNVIPEEFKVYKVRSKKAVIVNIEPTEKYRLRRQGSVLSILLGDDDKNVSNVVKTDYRLVHKGRCRRPTAIIKFFKEKDSWFTIWDGHVIAKYNNETFAKGSSNIIAMRTYLDEKYNPEQMKTVCQLFDTRSYEFKNIITFKQFQSQLRMLRPSK